MAFSIIYLGKRGGGAELTLKLLEDLSRNSTTAINTVVISPGNEKKLAYSVHPTQVIEFGGITRLEKLKAAIKVIFFPTKTIKEFGLKNGDSIIFPMVSPLDLPINYICRRKGIKVIRFLHDAKKHPGDFWPGEATISWVLKHSEIIVTLSEYVKSKIPDQYKSIAIVVPHPTFRFRKQIENSNFDLPPKYILFIGRIREYKGLKLLVKAWEKVKDEFDIDLVIAGEGRTKGIAGENFVFINRWLDDSEIFDLISEAEIVAFPYIEASQSGLIPTVMSFGKKIVITPMPGLIEQLNLYSRVQISKSTSEEDFAHALKLSLTKNFHKNHEKNLSTDFWLENLVKKLNELKRD